MGKGTPVQQVLAQGDTRVSSKAIVRRLAALWATCASVALAQAVPENAPDFKRLDSLEARVQGCVTCHGRDGQGSANGKYPRIAGKPARYLYNQLAYFRDGTRHYVPMNYLVAFLPDAYLQEMADYFSQRHPLQVATTAQTVDAAVLGRGKTLATQGDPQKGIPACVACHGERLTGMDPGIPGLAGLSEGYISGQLTRWRVGERHALDPDCMKHIASALSGADVGAVAAWVSEQKVPSDASPEPANLVRMPVACGSER